MGDEQDLTLLRFGDGQPAPAGDLADLHRKLLPTSPLLLLGRRFLEDFYYGVVPDEGLAFGTVAYENGRPVAFVVATADSNGFLSTAIKRRWRSLASITVRHPPSPKAGWQALRLLASRGRGGDTEPDLGEILSLGVLPPDAGGPSSSKVRRTLSHCLIDHVLTRLSDRPVIALVDETNAPARLMYSAMGWTVEKTVTAGWPVPQLVYRSGDRPTAA
jgi:hypothetical protein